MIALEGQVGLALAHLCVAQLIAQRALLVLRLPLLRLELCHARLSGVDPGGQGRELLCQARGDAPLGLDDLSSFSLLACERLEARLFGCDLTHPLALRSRQLIHTALKTLELPGADRSLGAQAGKLGQQIIGGQRGQPAARSVDLRLLDGKPRGQVGQGGIQLGLTRIQRGQILRQAATALFMPALRLPGTFGRELHAALLGREPALRGVDLVAPGC